MLCRPVWCIGQEQEYEHEHEYEYEREYEHEREHEREHEHEHEYEHEHEHDFVGMMADVALCDIEGVAMSRKKAFGES